MNILGLMSGSSLDGLDMALCNFEWSDEQSIAFNILAHREIEFPGELANALKNATSLSSYDLCQLDADFGIFLGQSCKAFIDEHPAHQVHYISSHGHTIFHAPADRFTKQIGSGAHIAKMAERQVICDFRSADIAADGQGAPFAPIADHYLFFDIDIMVNLGGIGNVSIKNESRIFAFDFAPVNQLLNFIASKKGLAFDKGGELASQGAINHVLLKKLKQTNEFNDLKPRGMDNTWVQKSFFKLIDNDEIEDNLRTVVEFISDELVKAVKLAELNKGSDYSMMVTGGGAFNDYLMQCIKSKIKHQSINIVPVSEEIIKFKEAVLMALMGYLRLKEQTNIFSSYTGAISDSIGGCIYAY